MIKSFLKLSVAVDPPLLIPLCYSLSKDSIVSKGFDQLKMTAAKLLNICYFVMRQMLVMML